MKQACKPGSVSDNHLSGTSVTGRLKPCEGTRRAALTFPKLLRMGFTHANVTTSRCGLLPRIFTLTPGRTRSVYFLLHFTGNLVLLFSLESPPPAVSRHPALRSPDFPHAVRHAIVQLTSYAIDCTTFYRQNQVFSDVYLF